MSKKLTQLKISYAELDYSERNEMREFIDKFEKSTISERITLNESFRKSLGPINSSSCPMCGK